PQATVLVERHVHGTADVGFRGHELDAESLRDAECLDGIARSGGGETREGPSECLRILCPACERGEREGKESCDAHPDCLDWYGRRHGTLQLLSAGAGGRDDVTIVVRSC